jgi:RNA polymerase sigma-70 factor (ECF subfamily)
MARNSDHISSEEKEFRDLYLDYHSRIYGYVLAIVHSPYAAEEITQELFIKLWAVRGELGHVANLEAYILAIARNKSLNYIKKAGMDARILSDLKQRMIPVVLNADDRLLAGDCGDLVEEALDRLSPQRRVVFRLSRYQGLNLEEIAGELHLSRNTVKNHLVAALRFVRSYLTRHGVTLLLTLAAASRLLS